MDDQIIVTLATIPSRIDGCTRAVNTLAPQCDQMLVWLNGLSQPVACSQHANVTYHGSPENIGPRGKFWFHDRMPGYHIVVDDDLIYPDNYVYQMTQHIEKLQRKMIIGLHGKLFLYRKPPEPMTFKFYRFNDVVSDYQPVHMLGTGVMAYHSSAFHIGMQDLQAGKIDDQVAILAQQQQTPMVVVPHAHDWVLLDEKLAGIDALHQDMQLKQETSNRIHAFPCWRLYTTDTNDVPNYF
jgi:hypothetical protein